MIGAQRFAGDLSFNRRMYDASLQLLRQCPDPSTVGRGLTVSVHFAAHLFSPISGHFEVLEESLELGLVSGDKHLYLFTVSSIALCRMYLGFDMNEIETYCSVAPEEFRDWEQDLRGGVSIIACRQLSRSLQGKTLIDSPKTVMSDENHNTAEYIRFIRSSLSKPDRYVSHSHC